MPKGESYLRDAGISFDVVSPSDVGLSQEDIGGSQLAPGMTTIGGQSIGDASAYGTGGSQLAPGMTTVTGQAIGGLGAATSQAAPRGRIKYRKCTKNFKKGCKGDNITTIQGLLYLNLKDTFLKGVKREDFVDGKFWTATDKAVRAFQKANKLGVDGVVGENTLEKSYNK